MNNMDLNSKDRDGSGDDQHSSSAAKSHVDKRRMWFALSTWIGIGLTAGIACGLFFGEYCLPLKVIGDAFVGLLRMTVLPYIAVSLVANLGKLKLTDTRRLAWIGGLTLLLLWSAALAAVFVLPKTFPTWTSGAFFSTSLIEQPDDTDLLSFFIPSNIFNALAGNQVPAIVVFCIASGLALSSLKDRKQLIVQLGVLSKVLLQVSIYITRLAPIGVFAIAASTAGTVSFEELMRLQTYLVAYTVGALFLGFIVLPLLVTLITPLTYRQVFRVAREPMITAFATGKLIIVLPMLIQNTERLFEELDLEGSDDAAPATDVLYATAYPFPHVGKILSLLFIPFAAWFIGDAMHWEEYPAFMTSGVFVYFGGPIIAIPFLLDQMHLPHDMFQLFLLSGIYGERIGDALGAMHLTTFSLIAAMGFRGLIKIGWRSAIKSFLYLTIAGVVTLVSVRLWLDHSVGETVDRNEILAQMHLIDRRVESTVFMVAESNPDSMEPDETLLERIRRRGIIRVGFNEDRLPFAFFNEHNELVGYDIDMAHALARDLDVTLEFVPFKRATLEDQLDDDHFDVVMSGLVGTLERSERMRHTRSYLDVNLALVVPDYLARSFKTLELIRSQGPIRVGFVDLSDGFVDRLQAAIPTADLQKIKKNSDYFTGKADQLDALLVSAESGAAFTISYPGYEVVVPTDLRVKLPLFYGIGMKDFQMQDFLEHWITLREKDGTADEYYDHWVLGKTKRNREPRWSVIRNVLGWVD